MGGGSGAGAGWRRRWRRGRRGVGVGRGVAGGSARGSALGSGGGTRLGWPWGSGGVARGGRLRGRAGVAPGWTSRGIRGCERVGVGVGCVACVTDYGHERACGCRVGASFPSPEPMGSVCGAGLGIGMERDPVEKRVPEPVGQIRASGAVPEAEPFTLREARALTTPWLAGNGSRTLSGGVCGDHTAGTITRDEAAHLQRRPPVANATVGCGSPAGGGCSWRIDLGGPPRSSPNTILSPFGNPLSTRAPWLASTGARLVCSCGNRPMSGQFTTVTVLCEP